MLRVMIADFRAATRKHLAKLLAREKYDVESVAGGQELLNKLGTSKPDLILFDMVMPELDGTELIARMQKLGEDIPVVLMGAKDAVPNAIPAGAADYISKPVNREELLVRVRRALLNHRVRSKLRVPLSELHDPQSGRIDAKKIAEFLGVPLARLAEPLGVNYPAAHKTPSAPGLQKTLRPIKRSIEMISNLTTSKSDARAWLNCSHPDLGGRTPIELILEGRAEGLVTLLENVLAGIPS
jgi:CheY-like chemotaxis protein